MISRASFEVVDALHKRFERRNWRTSYKALMNLEHLLTHGPRFEWGVNARKKSESCLRKARKVSRGIQGFWQLRKTPFLFEIKWDHC
ncbi:hypothetical protein AAHA92_21905 [Salvia divinorum]|uniref:ENTH domain-containing protein n=1 Tax=Salvia divinorum TaxID=28513 RepID=A0ABD1GLY3_SALDI